MPQSFIIDGMLCNVDCPGLWLYLRHVHTGCKYLFIVNLVQNLHVIPARYTNLRQTYKYSSFWTDKAIKDAVRQEKHDFNNGCFRDISVSFDIPTRTAVYLEIHDCESRLPFSCQALRSYKADPFFVTTEMCTLKK